MNFAFKLVSLNARGIRSFEYALSFVKRCLDGK